MARDLFFTPINEITFADIQELISSQAEEGPRLEFKETLSTSDGQPDRWFRDQSRIGRVARDELAKEIVAFANAYGGAVVVGIVETADNPSRAQQVASPLIPRVMDCVEQLSQALGE
jgi:predicted HTH transcriptional regulator